MRGFIGLISLGSALLVAPAFAEPAAPEVLGLDQVLELLHTQSPVLKSAQAGVDSATADVEKAWTAWQPNLSAVGQLTFNSVEQVFDFQLLAQGLAVAFLNMPLTAEQVAKLPDKTVIQPYVQIAGVLDLKQTLFNITAVRAPGVAEKGRLAAKTAVVAAEDELTFNAAQLYATLVGLKSLEAASLRAIEIDEKRIQDAKTQLDAGTGTKLQVTRAETEKAVAEGQLLALRSQRRTLLANLQALIGRDQPIEVSDTPLEKVVSLDIAEQPAQRSKVRAREQAVEAAEAAIGLSSASWLPSLAAEGMLRYSNVKGFSGDNFLATASVNLVIPLYDSGVRYADTHKAEAAAARAKQDLETERLNAAAFLTEAESKLDSAKAELLQADAQLRLATAAVEQVESLAQNGLSTNLELSDADSKRYQADQLVAQKKLEVDLAMLRLIYARGGHIGTKAAAK
ncbi:MAG: TolC family protein [Myxococcota bacterium]